MQSRNVQGMRIVMTCKTDFGISEFKSIAGKKGLGAGWIRLFLLALDQYRVFDKPLSPCLIPPHSSTPLLSLSQWQYKRRNVASNLFEKCHQRDVVNSDEAFHGLLPRRALIGPRDVSG